MGGEAPDVQDPSGLFDDVDHWVAFERAAGPGRVLDRDRQAVAVYRARLPEAQRFWERVTGRLVPDVERTTGLELRWRVRVREDEEVWPGPSVVGGTLLSGPVEPVRRPLLFPQIWFEAPNVSRQLPEMTDEDEALAYLADLVQEAVVEELHGAWPECPRHTHPLTVQLSAEGRPVWQCPRDPSVRIAVGSLGSASTTRAQPRAVDVVVEVGGWEHECCGPAIERHQVVDLHCTRWTGPDGRVLLVETHHHLEPEERVRGRVTGIEVTREVSDTQPVLRVPSGPALRGMDQHDDGHLEDPWTGDVVEWDGGDFLVTIRRST
ncbi:hypothetical protein SAMN05660464_2706 [Geodermatophilus dictyosporus]|uniref:Uncharacterized protein n=1 Tax=Geodermatophilus dictyosporus TaxID=1523247 RepID=A0A1I5PA08_9ACTN|nr:hypothetical protein [Geodermatophilus dictyosporus]SFP30813.1 hypothetical protein SAMN05660464_2706 [Geodermatophilus dictyosporus]